MFLSEINYQSINQYMICPKSHAKLTKSDQVKSASVFKSFKITVLVVSHVRMYSVDTMYAFNTGNYDDIRHTHHKHINAFV